MVFHRSCLSSVIIINIQYSSLRGDSQAPVNGSARVNIRTQPHLQTKGSKETSLNDICGIFFIKFNFCLA